MTRDQFIADYVIRSCMREARKLRKMPDERYDERVARMKNLAERSFDEARSWAEVLPDRFFDRVDT